VVVPERVLGHALVRVEVVDRDALYSQDHLRLVGKPRLCFLIIPSKRRKKKATHVHQFFLKPEYLWKKKKDFSAFTKIIYKHMERVIDRWKLLGMVVNHGSVLGPVVHRPREGLSDAPHLHRVSNGAAHQTLRFFHRRWNCCER
jgi:hypothetical protein